MLPYQPYLINHPISKINSKYNHWTKTVLKVVWRIWTRMAIRGTTHRVISLLIHSLDKRDCLILRSPFSWIMVDKHIEETYQWVRRESKKNQTTKVIKSILVRDQTQRLKWDNKQPTKIWRKPWRNLRVWSRNIDRNTLIRISLTMRTLTIRNFERIILEYMSDLISI